ncbi:MAG: 1-acyl-sn-glycerol-3-phosphate acyltransferase [Bacilli bacterium]|nr:1-acyl-sn-glycerol-3-phosphate acyltransferase [Bacilli bacterium]
MVLVGSIFILSIIIGFIIIYFSGLAAMSPWFYLLIPVIGVLGSGIIISIVWGGLLLFASKYKNVECRGKGSKFHQTWAYFLAKMLLLSSWRKMKKKGFQRIPKKEPCLYLFNHTSFLDCWMLLASIHPHVFSIVSLEAMKHVPFVGNLATALGCIYINKDKPETSLKMIDTAVDYIQNQNTSVAIAPEGKINREGKIIEFKNGPFTIAKRSNCPIVLLGFEGISEIENRKSFFKPVHLKSRVLTIIYPDNYADMSVKQLAKHCQTIYEDFESGKK